MLDLWSRAVGEEPTKETNKTARKVNHDCEEKNIEALLSRVEAFFQVDQDEAVSEFLNSSK